MVKVEHSGSIVRVELAFLTFMTTEDEAKELSSKLALLMSGRAVESSVAQKGKTAGYALTARAPEKAPAETLFKKFALPFEPINDRCKHEENRSLCKDCGPVTEEEAAEGLSALFG